MGIFAYLKSLLPYMTEAAPSKQLLIKPVFRTPCEHGVEQADCEVLCLSCRHPCRGHHEADGVCGAWRSERDPDYPYTERYVQRRCICDKFQ